MQALCPRPPKLPPVKAETYMSHEHHIYHLEREQHCREMAELASDPDVRRRHEELAALHAGRAAVYVGAARQTAN